MDSEPANADLRDQAPEPTCVNCLERIVGRPRSATRGPDCAWFGQCSRCSALTSNQLEIVEDRPDGQFIQILRCRRCGSTRACRPGWTTRCHVCVDARTSLQWIDGWLDLYRTIGPDSDLSTAEVEVEVRAFAGTRAGEALTDLNRAEYVLDLLQTEEVQRRARTGWTLLASDLYGLPWYDDPEPRASHGTWARHDACGKVQKLNSGRGRTECAHCPPDAASRTHRARATDPHLLYLVRHGSLQKYGHGDEARVRTHLRGGAEVVQVLEASHAEVVAAELTLKRTHARRLRLPRGHQLPISFGAGTEVLPTSIVVDLADVLAGVDVRHRFDSS